MSEKDNNLFSEFSPISTQEWEKILERDLKGKDYRKALRWETGEGVSVLPFYRSEDLTDELHHQQSLPGISSSWKLCEPIFDASPKEANRSIQSAIENGANFVQIRAEATPDDGLLGGDFHGTQIQSLSDLKQLLDGVKLGSIGLIFDSGLTSPAIAAMMSSVDGFSPRYLYDPFRYIAGRGRLPLLPEKLSTQIQMMADDFEGKTLGVDAAFYYNSGATIVQELGIGLAACSEYLNHIKPESRAKAAEKIFIQFSAGRLYFPEIAKLRAARLLWKNVLSGYDLDTDIPLTIHSEPATWNKTIADAHNNMLRATTESMSAVLGGTDLLIADPFDAHHREPNSFSKRIARNINHILAEEAHFGKVADPGSGSYYIEQLTDKIAEEAWSYFQMIEKQGGLIESLKANIIQREIGRSAEEKNRQLATRGITLTGTNDVPNIEDELPSDLYRKNPADSLRMSGDKKDRSETLSAGELSEAFNQEATIGDLATNFLQPQKQLYLGIAPYRASLPFEKIRQKTREFNSRTNTTCSAALVPVGHPKMRKARASFSENYLQCAGIVAHNHNGYSSIEEAESALKNEGHQIMVLCSSDDGYKDLVKPFCDTFPGEATIRILAGHPGGNEEEYRQAGIDFFIYTGSNLVDTLTDIQNQIFNATED